MRLSNTPVLLLHFFLISFLTLFLKQNVNAQCVPLPNGFAHNDYWHKRPLFDALDNGFTYIEADIYEREGRLIVAHLFPALNYSRTLENLYLKPLLDHVNKNNGKVYTGYNHPVTLMIDIKSNAERTYTVLKPLLQKYSEILSSYSNGKVHPSLVTIVLSGHKPERMISAENKRLAFIDEDLRLVDHDTLSYTNIYTMASCKYSKLLNWRGLGILPDIEKQRLCTFIKIAHKLGRKVRLWASPEDTHVWRTLLECGVDLINTDKLEELKIFLTKDKPVLASSAISQYNTSLSGKEIKDLIPVYLPKQNLK
jgi:hypothetical protein